MNERIKELAKEAGAYFGGGSTDYFGDYLPPYMSIKELDLEKFAELIVAECANLHFRGINEISAETENKIYNMIKEHFGVEE